MAKKFRKGRQIKDISEALAIILTGHWVYYNHKPVHPGWASSWTIRTLQNAVIENRIFVAIREPEKKERTDAQVENLDPETLVSPRRSGQV